MNKIPTLCVLVFAISCADNDSQLKQNPIDSKIIIETREVLASESRSLTFHCKTEKIYPCMNYPILTKSAANENSFEITFTGVGEMMLCLTALGPATTTVDLDVVPNGEYQIELNNAALKNKGFLRVSEAEIKLIFQTENGIEILRPTTRRVPQNTYWGTIGYHVASSGNLADAFLQKLSDNGAAFNKQAPGHYYYYEIDQNGDIVADVENSGYYFMKAFIFSFDGDESDLKALVAEEGGKYKSELTINMQTFRGESLNNWAN